MHAYACEYINLYYCIPTAPLSQRISQRKWTAVTLAGSGSSDNFSILCISADKHQQHSHLQPAHPLHHYTASLFYFCYDVHVCVCMWCIHSPHRLRGAQVSGEAASADALLFVIIVVALFRAHSQLDNCDCQFNSYIYMHHTFVCVCMRTFKQHMNGNDGHTFCRPRSRDQLYCFSTRYTISYIPQCICIND